MAGIGFVLRRLTQQDNLIGIAQGYLYSALISAGPFLVTVLAMGSLNLFADQLADQQVAETFRMITIYNFSLSLLSTGPLLLVMTRYLADRIYEQRVDEAVGMLVGGLGLAYAIQLPIVLMLYFWYANLAPVERLAAALHFFLVSGIWVVSIFLSALKDYRSIGVAFAGGMLAGFAGGWLLMGPFGAAGMLFGFSLGLAGILFGMILRVMLEYPYSIRNPFGFVSYFGKYWELAVFGFVYNAAIWVDKLVMWLADDAQESASRLVSNPPYDSAMFLAHLTTIPALAVFVVSIETEFFEHYQKFYRAIQHHATLAEIRQNQRKIIEVLSLSGRNILILQTIICVLAILASPALLGLLHVEAVQIGIFRLGVLGSLFQILFVFLGIVLAYFDLRHRLMQISLFYLVMNAISTYLTLDLGFAWYGYGFFIASLAAFLFAFLICVVELRRLPYLTFVKNNSSIS